MEWLCKCWFVVVYIPHSLTAGVTHTYTRTGCRTNVRTRTHIQANFVVFVRAGQTMWMRVFVLFLYELALFLFFC